eukprot:2038225-Karenia_brevis.AAC.1
MNLEWASVWEAKVSIPYVWRFQERDRLSAFAKNELRVGLSMGSKSVDFSNVLKLQERDRLSAFTENELRVGF